MCCNELIKIIGASDVEICFKHATSAKENGKHFRINTQKKVCRVKNDGCLNNSQTEKKCDYIFKVCDTNEVVLVEFKGEDVDAAVSQVVATYNKLLPALKNENPTYSAYIVSSSIPKSAEQSFRKLQKNCWKMHKLNVDKKHFKCEITI